MANHKIQKPIKKGNNMRNMFTYDFTNRTIVATKATLKKASNPTTDEYTALIKMIEGQPTFRVVEKTIKNSGNKKTYKGLTLKMMMDYISNQKNSEELMAEFNEAQGDAKNKYPSAKQWFLNEFPDFTMKNGKDAVSKAKIVRIKRNAKAKMVNFPVEQTSNYALQHASNQ